jgi:hypothetical protein
MINWLSIIKNSVWILGAALGLSALSLGYYRSRTESQKLGKILDSPPFALSLNTAGALIALGMGLTAGKWWEIGLWVILAVSFIFGVILHYRSAKK